MRKVVINIIVSFFSIFSLSAQNGLLDQYIFSAEDDSMQIVDYLDPNTNYVFTLYGDWCGWCKKELRDYEDIYPQWQEDFNMTFVVLDDYGSDDIEQAIQDLSDYPYEVFVTKSIRMPLGVTGFPRNYFVTAGKQLVYEKPGYASPEDMTELLDQLFDKNLKSNLPPKLVQSASLYSDCEYQPQIGELTEESIELNGLTYQLYNYNGQEYFLREESDFSRVYIYDDLKEEEYTLIDFTKEICETVSIYSVFIDTIIDLKVLDKYCVGQDLYMELDLILADCQSEERNMTFVSGLGSNAGLIPIFDNDQCYSYLNCQWEEGSIVFSESEDCLLLNNEDISLPEVAVTVWPNPASESINIVLSPNFLSGSLSLTSIQGEELMRTSIQKRIEIESSDFPAGIYLLTYTTEQSQSFTEKIIIK